MGVRHVKQLPLGAPERLLELQIMIEEARHEEEYPGVQGTGVRHVKQLPLGAPGGLHELEIMTEEDRHEEEYPGVLGM